MAYKWRPSKAQRKAFAERMKNPAEREAYETRKEERAAKRRAGSKFSYESAGGRFVPTQAQYEHAGKMLATGGLTDDEDMAARAVISGYVCNDIVHHDFIHIVNEHARKQP